MAANASWSASTGPHVRGRIPAGEPAGCAVRV